MLCSRCGMDTLTHKGLCLSCLWLNIVPEGVDVSRCVNCGLFKPGERFKGQDNTCMLCRKLMVVTQTRFSHKLEISKETMLSASDGGAICLTCNSIKDIEYFPPNSFECTTCWGIRNLTEIVRVGEKYDDILFCRSCHEEAFISAYPIGRLTCRRCINKANGSRT